MTKELRRLSIVVLAMFIALLVATSWIQVVDQENLAQNPLNSRTREDSYQIQRGAIIADGQEIASSERSDDKYRYQRTYKDGEMWAPVTGYFNPVLNSSTALENALNVDLSGTGSNTFFAEIERIFSGQPPRGFSVETTLNAKAQKAAWEALQGYQGAVVALEPDTGRVLAMASTPSFDPNKLAAHDSDAVNKAYDALSDDPKHPLSNRAIAGNLNPPGSTFKIVVASAAIAGGDYTLDSKFKNPARYRLPQSSATVRNAWGGTCGGGKTTTLREALRLSCNIPMAELAVELGDKRIREMAESLGFNQGFEIPLKSTVSTYADALDDPQTALTGFGQGQVTATPLQMAMVASGLANDGVVMNPRMVDRIISDDLAVQRTYDDSQFGTAMDPSVADAVTEAMVASVSSGAASNARIEGTDVAGKTGTAENGDDPYTLWFTGFAPADDPQVAVAVVIEDGGGKDRSGSGNELAAPIAKKVIEAVLGK